MSTPRPRAPCCLAAAITSRPSPEPRSMTKSRGPTDARRASPRRPSPASRHTAKCSSASSACDALHGRRTTTTPRRPCEGGTQRLSRERTVRPDAGMTELLMRRPLSRASARRPRCLRSTRSFALPFRRPAFAPATPAGSVSVTSVACTSIALTLTMLLAVADLRGSAARPLLDRELERLLRERLRKPQLPVAGDARRHRVEVERRARRAGDRDLLRNVELHEAIVRPVGERIVVRDDARARARARRGASARAWAPTSASR